MPPSHAELVHYCRIDPRMSSGGIPRKWLGKHINDFRLSGEAWLRSHIDSDWFDVPSQGPSAELEALESRLLCGRGERSGESRGEGSGESRWRRER